MQILTIRKGFEDENSNTLNEIWSIRMHIQRNSNHSNGNLNYANEIWTLECKF